MIFEAAFCRMILQSFLAGLLVIPVAFLFLYICGKRTDLIEKIDCKKAWWILRVLSLALMMKLAFSFEVNLTWDWGGLIKSSYNYIQNGSIDIPDYYARYPNNQFWLLCLVTLFKFIKLFAGGASVTVYKRVTMVISVIFVQIAFEFIYRTARLIFSEKKAFFTGLLALFCLPLYLYSGFFYTDIPSVLLVSIMLFLYFKLQQTENKKEKIIVCVLLGFVGAITYFVKLTAFIVFVAMIIGIIFTKITFKQFLSFFLVSVMTLGVTVAAVKAVTVPIYKNKFGITEEMKDKYEFPPTHWIMMGLGFGGFSQEDIDRTKSFDTYEERENFNKREIKNRIENYGFLGLVNHLFSDKVIRTFGSCTLAGGDYVGRKPFHKSGIFSRLLYLYNARYTFLGDRKSEEEEIADESETSRRQNFNFCNILLYAHLGMQQQVSVGILSCYDSSRRRRTVALCEHIQKVHKATPHKLKRVILPKRKNRVAALSAAARFSYICTFRYSAVMYKLTYRSFFQNIP